MLEPTKEPLKPLSAAEKIASIGQTTSMSPEMNTCTSDQFQVKNICMYIDTFKYIYTCMSTHTGHTCIDFWFFKCFKNLTS